MKLGEVLSGPEKWLQCRGPYEGKSKGAICLFTALLFLNDPDPVPSADLVREQNRLLSLLGLDTLEDGFAWNDDPARTWPEVQDVVRAYDFDRMVNP